MTAFRLERETLELLLDLAAGVHVIDIDKASGLVVNRSYED